MLSATMPLHGLYDRFPYKSAATSQSGNGIDITDDRVIEFNVHSHMHVYSTELWAIQRES